MDDAVAIHPDSTLRSNHPIELSNISLKSTDSFHFGDTERPSSL
jgi:hypothetical protein